MRELNSHSVRKKQPDISLATYESHWGGRGGEGGGLNLQPNFQKGRGLTGPQILEGGYWERGVDLIQGWLRFSHKK